MLTVFSRMLFKIKYQNDNNQYEFTSFNEIKNYDKVVYIDCSDNQLTSLPELPNSLQVLFCSMNQLTSLPELPNSLQYLYCHNNQLTELPNLPNSLQYLDCENNKLTSLPNVPNSINYLYLKNNNFLTSYKYDYLNRII